MAVRRLEKRIRIQLDGGQSDLDRPLGIEHLHQGKTDNVFRISLPADGQLRSLILKEYLEDWHRKEIFVYRAVLGGKRGLGQPKVLFSGKNYLALEDLARNPEDGKFGANGLRTLKTWIERKHRAFLGISTRRLTETRKTQSRYLIEKPLESINRLRHKRFPDLERAACGKLLKSHFLFEGCLDADRRLPRTLEHGDLEIQNLLIGGSGRLRVIDWVNARIGSGLFDINQYFEDSRILDAGIDAEKDMIDFSRLTGIRDFAGHLAQARALMLLNKINFYAGRWLTGIGQERPTAIRDRMMLKGYLDELVGLVRKIS